MSDLKRWWGYNWGGFSPILGRPSYWHAKCKYWTTNSNWASKDHQSIQKDLFRKKFKGNLIANIRASCIKTNDNTVKDSINRI